MSATSPTQSGPQSGPQSGVGFHSHDVHHPSDSDPVVIDCDRCTVRGIGCGDCVVTVLLGGPPEGVRLADDERTALNVLADAGLVPPLRMVEAVDTRHLDLE